MGSVTRAARLIASPAASTAVAGLAPAVVRRFSLSLEDHMLAGILVGPHLLAARALKDGRVAQDGPDERPIIGLA